MRQAIALVFVFLVMATGAFGATCQGRNLLPDLDPAERGSLDAIIARVPFAKGNAWRATRGDEVVTLVGTYHFDDPRFDAVMERHLPEIRAARTVLVEAGREETEALRSATEKDPRFSSPCRGRPCRSGCPRRSGSSCRRRSLRAAFRPFSAPR
ncbi:TraB/GumN family protein [Albidovulum sp.]|uniref:TraB/GumN family protein n=1 Tax=Albidovulum sp. TaxID=1872424 RepID=UPI00352991EB